MNVKERVRELGATEQQLDSKIFKMTERALIGATDTELKEAVYNAALQLNDMLAEKIGRAEKLTRHYDQTESSLSRRMRTVSNEMDELEERLKDAKTKLTEQNSQAVATFEHILSSVQTVFGEENMTELVMCQAIEAGSFAAWGCIVGDKKMPKAEKRY